MLVCTVAAVAASTSPGGGGGAAGGAPQPRHSPAWLNAGNAPAVGAAAARREAQSAGARGTVLASRLQLQRRRSRRTQPEGGGDCHHRKAPGQHLQQKRGEKGAARRAMLLLRSNCVAALLHCSTQRVSAWGLSGARLYEAARVGAAWEQERRRFVFTEVQTVASVLTRRRGKSAPPFATAATPKEKPQSRECRWLKRQRPCVLFCVHLSTALFLLAISCLRLFARRLVPLVVGYLMLFAAVGSTLHSRRRSEVSAVVHTQRAQHRAELGSHAKHVPCRRRTP